MLSRAIFAFSWACKKFVIFSLFNKIFERFFCCIRRKFSIDDDTGVVEIDTHNWHYTRAHRSAVLSVCCVENDFGNSKLELSSFRALILIFELQKFHITNYMALACPLLELCSRVGKNTAKFLVIIEIVDRKKNISVRTLFATAVMWSSHLLIK